jgi:hypothetical protein
LDAFKSRTLFGRFVDWVRNSTTKSEKENTPGTQPKPRPGEKNNEEETGNGPRVGPRLVKWAVWGILLLPGALLVVGGLWLLGLVTGISLTIGDLVEAVLMILTTPIRLGKKK